MFPFLERVQQREKKEHQKSTSKLNQVFKQSDFIKSFDEISNYSQKITLSKFWEVKIVSGLKIYFYSLDLTNNSINIVNQVSVDSDMKVKVFLKGNENIINNWRNLKNLDQTFVFPDFDNFSYIKYAKFADIKFVYDKEKSMLIKKAFKLSYTSVFPNNLERQKVYLADNICQILLMPL